MNAQVKEIIEQLDAALKQFGEYPYYDKGPREVMDVDSIVNRLRPLPGTEAGAILRMVAEEHEHGRHLVNHIAERFETMPEDWVEEMLRVSGAEI